MDSNESLTIQSAVGLDEGTNTLFPVFLKLEQMRLLIVGGGNIGLEKLQAVLANSPHTSIRLVAETISDDIRNIASDHRNITLHTKTFDATDLQDIDVAIVAINVKETSTAIAKLAKEKQVLVNVADTPELCDFYLSSVVHKGNVKIAISTNGKSPTLAKRLKETLNHALPAELDDLAINLHKVRNTLNGSFEAKVHRLNKLTSTLHANESRDRADKWMLYAKRSLLIFGSMLIGGFIFKYVPFQQIADGTIDFYLQLDNNFGWILLAGFLAQIIDGSLGMGYGITSATIMLSAGVPPAAMSGSIHTAEMFASGASGLSHYRFGNVNKKLFKAIVIPGVLGAIAGAWLLVKFGDSHAAYIRPIMACYTLFLGIKFVLNAFRKTVPKQKFKHYKLLAGTGGFLDSFGGGGWGPIVTSTLINRGRTPKYVIGTVSLTEFFVTLSSAFAFFIMIGVSHWQAIVALIIGSLVAAPIAARLAGKMPRKTAFMLLGALVIIWSIKILWKIF
ncbi:MAG TPA: TSUP family transporter [Phnomibacter sp.]|nr:TSUP family transporter [Phnomibacter sp.]